MKTEVDLVRFDGGNTGSVQRCLNRIGVNFRVVDKNNLPDGSRPLLVPGVGAFGSVMNVLKQDGLDVAIGNAVGKGTPYIGICVGMQILFDESEESPNAAGLGLVSGKVVKFVADKVPQIGWNEIEPQQAGFERGFVYFVNSYFAQPEQKSTVLYSSEYGGNFCAAVQKDNIIGFQFHPEKSGAFGNELLKRTIVNACRN